MTCHICDNEQISFTFKNLSLCVEHRHELFRALLYDFKRAGLVEGISKELEEGAKALDRPGKPEPYP
jgi:hypothetical protein